MRSIIFFTLFCLLVLSFFQSPLLVLAQSDDTVHINSVGFTEEQPTPTPEEVKPKPVVEKPFMVFRDTAKAADPKTFTLSLSQRLLDFGELSPSNAVNRAVTVRIYNSMRVGYSLFGLEDHPLRQLNGIPIPDTTCDNGACSESIAAPWVSGLTYGFGYRCDDSEGSICPAVFNDPSVFKQLSDSSASEDFALLLQSNREPGERAAAIKMQINTAGSQAQGSYSTAVTLLTASGF
jgi:hypothetical protein